MAGPLMGNIEKLNAMGLPPGPPIERREANRSHIYSSTLENQPSIGSFGSVATSVHPAPLASSHFNATSLTDRLSFNVIRHVALSRQADPL